MYCAVTHEIEVAVEPTYLEEHSDPSDRRYVWAYTVEVRNRSACPVRLRARYWRITDANGRIEEVRGPGVVGEQPTIAPGSAFRYTSGCPLTTSSGIMAGEYEMEGDDGARFTVAIPAFSLDVPGMARAVN